MKRGGGGTRNLLEVIRERESFVAEKINRALTTKGRKKEHGYLSFENGEGEKKRYGVTLFVREKGNKKESARKLG